MPEYRIVLLDSKPRTHIYFATDREVPSDRVLEPKEVEGYFNGLKVKHANVVRDEDLPHLGRPYIRIRTNPMTEEILPRNLWAIVNQIAEK